MTSEFLGLRGKRAVVTGGSRGVGRATALLLARAGVHVGIGYLRRRDEAEGLVAELRELGVKAWASGGDLSREDEVTALFDRAEDAFGGVDIVVGNHGIWPARDIALSEMPLEHWQRTIRINLEGLFLVSREASRRLADGGRLVLVSSTAAQRGEAFHGDYAAAKGALVSLVKGLCVELAPRDITVNSVAPGWIETEMSQEALEGEGLERALASIPLRRIATAEDVAGPIVFLCSALARHVTGEVVNVNGGAVLPG
ncbi:MAG: SDR family oxidoreductase [Gemmatimonadota bacterium]